MTLAKIWTGTVGRELLFAGSKSEGKYLVLRTDSNVLYRLRVFNNDTTDALNPWVGMRVSIEGREDDLRGHRRLTVTLDAIKAIHVLDQTTPSVQTSADALKSEIIETLHQALVSHETLVVILSMLKAGSSSSMADQIDTLQDKKGVV